MDGASGNFVMPEVESLLIRGESGDRIPKKAYWVTVHPDPNPASDTEELVVARCLKAMKAKNDIKQFSAIGHKLKPVVTVAGKGLTENVMLELERALTDHELIKVKLAVPGKDNRQALSEAICQQTRASVIQSIGSIVLLLRRSPEPDPRLSNLMRPL